MGFTFNNAFYNYFIAEDEDPDNNKALFTPLGGQNMRMGSYYMSIGCSKVFYFCCRLFGNCHNIAVV